MPSHKSHFYMCIINYNLQNYNILFQIICGLLFTLTNRQLTIQALKHQRSPLKQQAVF